MNVIKDKLKRHELLIKMATCVASQIDLDINIGIQSANAGVFDDSIYCIARSDGAMIKLHFPWRCFVGMTAKEVHKIISSGVRELKTGGALNVERVVI